MEPISIDELMNLPVEEFIERFKLWIKEFNDGNPIDVLQTNPYGKMTPNPLLCPLHVFVVKNNLKCNKELVSNTANCPLCGHPICPECYNHKVDQLSRVTGYMAPVSGYNASKQQEFKDRQRHTLE